MFCFVRHLWYWKQKSENSKQDQDLKAKVRPKYHTHIVLPYKESKRSEVGSQVLKLTDWILKNFGDNAGLDMSWQPESNGSLLCKWRITFGDFLSWQPKRNGSLLCKRRITFGDFMSWQPKMSERQTKAGNLEVF